MLIFGTVFHIQMREEGLVHGETIFPVSLTLITAFILLAIGVAAIANMEFHVGPFG
jgi:putative membrane protein